MEQWTARARTAGKLQLSAYHRSNVSRRHRSLLCLHLLANGKMVFLSFFMSTTVRPSASAASSALSRCPMAAIADFQLRVSEDGQKRGT
jgi:hypothetical protein